jgi:hypothetical protein
MTAAELRAEIVSARRLGSVLAVGLMAVAIGALIFTLVNVTLFATANGVHPAIAWLLDPLASLTLVIILLADGWLSRHGRTSGAWPTTTKWFAGGATWAMNTWTSWMAGPDWARLLLHSVAPALVLLLAESAPRMRRRFAATAAGLEAQLAKLLADEQARVEAERAAREREFTSALQVTSPAPAPIPPPARRQVASPAQRQPSRQPRLERRLVEKARPLVAAGAGRHQLARQLNITEHQARVLLAEVKKPPQLAAVGN